MSGSCLLIQKFHVETSAQSYFVILIGVKDLRIFSQL